MRASPMSGLLSAMMSSSDGTQFSLDFLIVQIHHWHLHLAQCITKPHLVPPRQFRRFAQRELAGLEEPDCELKLQLLLDFAAWPAARHQQVIRILDCHFSHEITIPRVAVYPQVLVGSSHFSGARTFLSAGGLAGWPSRKGGQEGPMPLGFEPLVPVAA